MSEKFNPLKAWLGVTAGKPSYYQLLGLENFESEPPVIADAADRAIRRVQKHLQGEHREAAEKLARDLATVKGVLLSSEKRHAYDAQLRGKLGGGSSPKLAPAPSAAVVLPQAVEATDSPTMMLPPGALSAALGRPGAALPAAALPPAALPPQALGPGGAYGAPSPAGYADPGAYGLPQPQAAPNPFAPQPGIPQPFGQENHAPGFGSPYGGDQVGAYNYGPPGGVQQAAPMSPALNPMIPQAVEPSAQSGVPFAPKTTMVRTRVAGRKQQQSNFTVALTVLGVAAVVLVVVIVVVSQRNAEQDAEQAKLTAAPPPRAQPNVAPLPSQNIPVAPAIPSSRPGGSVMTPPMFEPPSESDSERERRMAAEKAAMSESSKVTMSNEPAKPEAVPVGMRGVEVKPVVMEASLPEDAVRAKSVPTMLSAARTAIRTRDYFKAEDVILQAQITADSPALVQSTLDHARALDLVRSFWEGVREGIKGLKAGDELTFNAKTAVVVRHDEVNLVVKQDNKEIPLVIDKLIPGLAAQLAERGLAKDAASTKLVVGMFLVLDQTGDHAAGRKLFDEAAAGGLDVNTLRPIIEAK